MPPCSDAASSSELCCQRRPHHSVQPACKPCYAPQAAQYQHGGKHEGPGMTPVCHTFSHLSPCPGQAGQGSLRRVPPTLPTGGRRKNLRVRHEKTGCPPAGSPPWKASAGTAAARKRAAEQAARAEADSAACEIQAAPPLQSWISAAGCGGRHDSACAERHTMPVFLDIATGRSYNHKSLNFKL